MYSVIIDTIGTGKKILDLREREHVDVNELSSFIKVSVRTLKDVEKGKKSPSLKTLVGVCNFFGATLDDMIVYDLIRE